MAIVCRRKWEVKGEWSVLSENSPNYQPKQAVPFVAVM